MASLHLNLEYGASLNARELTREKKVDMGGNLQPKNMQPKYVKYKECLTQADEMRV